MKRQFIISLFALCSIFAAESLKAQTTLTLQEARKQALEHNKNLASARVTLEKQRYDTKAMYANFLPKFSARVIDFYSTGSFDFNKIITPLKTGVTNGITQMITDAVSLSPEGASFVQQELSKFLQEVSLPEDYWKLKVQNVFSGSVSFVEPLYMGGKINAGYKMNQLGMKMAETNIQLTESQVLLNTDEAYVLCIKAKELGQVAKAYKDLLLELQKNVEGAIRHGMKTRNDALKVEVKLNEAELNILKAENGLRLAQMNLAQVVGLPLSEKIDVSTDGIYNVQPLEAQNGDISQRPEKSLLADKTQMAALKVKLARSEFLPNLIMGASYSYTNGMKMMNSTLMKSGSFSAGVMLSIPIYHFGEGKNKIRSAKASHRIAQIEEDELSEKMLLEQMQAYNNLTEAASEITLTEKSVDSATQNMKTSKQQFEVGTEPLSDYLESQVLWQKASASAVEARCKYLLAQSKYLKTCGQLGSGE